MRDCRQERSVVTSLDTLAHGDPARQRAAMEATNSAFSTVSMLSTAIPIVGQIVGTALAVVGAIISFIMESVYDHACDENYCHGYDGSSYNEETHRRAAIGINVPKTAKRKKGGVPCEIDDWGAGC